jgi:2,3-bisphosphoglycerate-dependent phosphoglycerate mutase
MSEAGYEMDAIARTPFWFLRHGETDWNAQHLSQGNIDIPLNPTGIAQAREAAVRLRNRGIATIVTSPLSRAQDTAQIVADTLGLPIALDEGLREVSFGVQEGQPMTEWFSAWVEGTFTPELAESFADLRARAKAAINRALAQPAPVLVVAHGALFRALRAEMGLEPNVRTPNATPFWCEPCEPAWALTLAR